MSNIVLRDTEESDFPTFFEHYQDTEAYQMAAFTATDPQDRAAFNAYWTRILANTANFKQTILVDERIAGNMSSFDYEGERTVGYWFGKEFWGKGIATQALAQFLIKEKTRPLFARVAKDNIGSRRVLEKSGFKIVGEDRGFANARQAEIEEFILQLDE